jgi:hypothetical protein
VQTNFGKGEPLLKKLGTLEHLAKRTQKNNKIIIIYYI